MKISVSESALKTTHNDEDDDGTINIHRKGFRFGVRRTSLTRSLVVIKLLNSSSVTSRPHNVKEGHALIRLTKM